MATPESTNHSFELRKNVVNSIISFCDLIFYELPPKTRGDIVYFIHFYGFGAIIFYTLFFGKKFAFQAILLVGFVIILQLFLLRGCVLTKVEQHYLKEKGTTVDVFLNLLSVDLTNENRKLISLTAYSIIFLAFFGIYLREIFFKTTME
jgi:hypothetical protein